MRAERLGRGDAKGGEAKLKDAANLLRAFLPGFASLIRIGP